MPGTGGTAVGGQQDLAVPAHAGGPAGQVLQGAPAAGVQVLAVPQGTAGVGVAEPSGAGGGGGVPLRGLAGPVGLVGLHIPAALGPAARSALGSGGAAFRSAVRGGPRGRGGERPSGGRTGGDGGAGPGVAERRRERSAAGGHGDPAERAGGQRNGPAVRRRKLGAELRALRTGAGLTSGEAARL
ncbi:hypothetical protein AB0F45_38995, partial [Streptomyces achromogenes]